MCPHLGQANGAVFSQEICRKLIEAAEETGFKMAVDSIDQSPAMDISVYVGARLVCYATRNMLFPRAHY